MKTPRSITGEQLAKLLKKYGYEIVRQNGSHIRLTTLNNGEHHITIPNHSPLKVGTLHIVLSKIAQHLNISKSALAEQLFN